MTDIPDENSTIGCSLCCLEGNIYLVGGDVGHGPGSRVSEYNPRTNTWRNLPCLQQERSVPNVCTLDNKIFVMGGDYNVTSCEMLDMSDDDPQWRYISKMNSDHFTGGAVVVEKKIYVLGGYEANNDEVYDVDKGILMEYLQTIVIDIYRSVEHTYQQVSQEIKARCCCC